MSNVTFFRIIASASFIGFIGLGIYDHFWLSLTTFFIFLLSMGGSNK